MEENNIIKSARMEANIYKQDIYSNVKEWIQKNIPDDKDASLFLIENSLSSDLPVKNNYFNQVNNIIKENTEEDKRCNKEKIIIIGMGKNGDPIVYDIINKKVGYIFHDEYYEDDQINPRDCLVLSKLNIKKFYVSSYQEQDFPRDGYDLEESDKYKE